MGAGAINPFYNPQTSSPISMFVPDQLPVDLMLKAGLARQGQQDQARAILETQIDTNAAYTQDKAYREKVNKDLETFRDKYYMQDLTTPQTQSDIYRFVQGVKNDKLLQQTDTNTKQAAEFAKLADDYRKSNAYDYADENFFRGQQLQKAYEQSGQVGSVGDLNATKGLHLNDERAKLFNDIKGSGYTDKVGKNTKVGDYLYGTSYEGIDANRIDAQAQASLSNYASSAAGKQERNMFDMIKHNNPEAFSKLGKTNEEQFKNYLLTNLRATGSENIYSKTGSSYKDTYNKAVDASAAAQAAAQAKTTEDPGSTWKISSIASDISDFDAKIKEAKTEPEKSALRLAKQKAIYTFEQSPEGNKVLTEFNKEKTKASNYYAGTIRQELSDDEKQDLKNNKINVDDFTHFMARKISDSKPGTAYDPGNFSAANDIATYLNSKGIKDKAVLRRLTDTLFQAGVSSRETSWGEYDFNEAARNYNSAFGDFVDSGNVITDTTIRPTSQKTQEELDKHFGSSSYTNYKVIGEDDAKSREILAARWSSPKTFRYVNDAQGTPQLEIDFKDTEGKSIEKIRVLATGETSTDSYNRGLDLLGDQGTALREARDASKLPIGDVYTDISKHVSGVNTNLQAKGLANNDGFVLRDKTTNSEISIEDFINKTGTSEEMKKAMAIQELTERDLSGRQRYTEDQLTKMSLAEFKTLLAVPYTFDDKATLLKFAQNY